MVEEGFYPEFGGVRGNNFQGFVPTGLTYLFIVVGYNCADRIVARNIFTQQHTFAREKVISLEPHFKGEPSLCGKIHVEENWLEFFTVGEIEIREGTMKY